MKFGGTKYTFYRFPTLPFQEFDNLRISVEWRARGMYVVTPALRIQPPQCFVTKTKFDFNKDEWQFEEFYGHDGKWAEGDEFICRTQKEVAHQKRTLRGLAKFGSVPGVDFEG